MTITVATTQYQIDVLSFEDYLKKTEALVKTAKSAGADLLLLPEYAGIEIGDNKPSEAELFFSIQKKLNDYIDFFQQLSSQYKIYLQPGTLPYAEGKQYKNRAYFFGPNQKVGFQDKIQLVPYEINSGLISSDNTQTLFETALGKIGIAICYDCEFPQIIDNLTYRGATLILVPSYTVSLAGFYRVAISAQARAIENQCYVMTAMAVGNVLNSEPIETVRGQAGIYCPADKGFPADGILKVGDLDKIECIVTTLDFEKLKTVRQEGDVRNYTDTLSLPQKGLLPCKQQEI